MGQDMIKRDRMIEEEETAEEEPIWVLELYSWRKDQISEKLSKRGEEEM